MTLCIGEILVDIIETENERKLFVGGAPFNVAVNIKDNGGKVGFLGAVGDDDLGTFLIDKAKRYQLDFLNIKKIKHKNTTSANIKIENGERFFTFNRDNCCDDLIDVEDTSFDLFDIVVLGSLLLTTEEGTKVAKKVIDICKKKNIKVAFDVNYREDLFDNVEQFRHKNKDIIYSVDILKMTESELLLFTDESDLKTALKKVSSNNKLIVITLGDEGSIYYYLRNNIIYSSHVKTDKVIPIDATGAGDAFFGTVVNLLDGVNLLQYSDDKLDDFFIEVLTKGNKKGEQATQFFGAIKNIND